MKNVSKKPIPLIERNASVPEDLCDIVMQCLSKEPQDRFQDADSLREALADCRDARNWTRGQARSWWENYGCPNKKALDREVFATSSI